MSRSVRVVRAAAPSQWQDTRRLIEEYAASLGIDLGFQDFTGELERLAIEYGPPRGALLLAMDGDMVAGCVGLRPFDTTTGEVKRLYIVPAARGRAIGRTLANAVVALACDLGYQRLVLDTLPSMRDAQALYTSIGFKPIDAYRFNPIAGTVFMELVLAN